MYVVLGVCHRRTTTWTEVAIDGWSNDHMVAGVFDAVIVPTMKIPFQDKKGGGHVVVAVWDNRPVLVQCKDLMAEYQIGGQTFHPGQRRLQAQFPSFLWVDVLR